MKKTLIIAGLVAASLTGAQGAFAAGATVKPPMQDWTFAGPFGSFDRAQLQRGFKVFKESCAACHGMQLLAFRNLSEPGGPEYSEAQVKALAATYQIKDGPNDAGEMFERPGRPADRWPSPFPNPQAAAAAMGGKAPPDLSLIAKARTYERGFPYFIFDIFTQHQETGQDYLKALLTGYTEPPAGFEVPPGGHYNTYFPGNVIAMPNPLSDGQIEYPKDANGRPVVPETAVQYAKDVTAFLTWVAEPHLEARKRIGFQVMLFLIVFAGLLYFTKKKIWGRAGGEAEGHAA